MFNRIARMVVWLCAQFNRQEIELIITGLQDVLADRDPEVKPRDDFKKNIRTIARSPSIRNPR